MKNAIYDEQSNNELNAIIDSCIKVNSEAPKTQVTDEILYNFTGDESYNPNKTVDQILTPMPDFKHISEVYKNAEMTKPKADKFFTPKKGKIAFSIDKTIFEPSPVVALSTKSFEEKYVKQLEQYIFNDKDDLDVDKIIGILHLITFIKNGTTPIGLVTNGKFKYLLPKICNGMNTFFFKNYATILSILEMFSGSNNIAQQPEGTDV